MALNRFMHPRNIYMTPPNFEKLTKQFKEFAQIARMDVIGHVTIDFQDMHALRVLTKCLLKLDFNLDVDIPEERLVPTLPLRLNYVLWIEDLMAAIRRDLNIRGIDIGTGACAIYSLLAAVKNRWEMLATDVDALNIQKAQENVERNNLQSLITIKDNKGSKVIENLVTKQNTFDFCMCNPPFYSSLQELYESRSPARRPPKNGFTGSPQELITDGGELEFSRRLIDESKRCKDHVLIFTTMVGHKTNLLELLHDLKTDGIKHTHTEFCQGRVTRWGVAWTFKDYDLYKLVPPRDKPRKKKVPIPLQLPPLPNCDYNLETAHNKLKSLISGLKIEQRLLNKCGNRIALDLLAVENTWSNQRRIKRLRKRMEATETKKAKLDNAQSSSQETIDTNASTSKSADDNNLSDSNEAPEAEIIEQTDTDNNKAPEAGIMEQTDTDYNEAPEAGIIGQTDTDNNEAPEVGVLEQTDTDNNEAPEAGIIEQTDTDSDVGPEEEEDPEKPDPLFHAFLKLFKKEDTVQLEIEFLNGTGGKESVHQVVQFIKNNWK